MLEPAVCANSGTGEMKHQAGIKDFAIFLREDAT
jgi:hypothetical protein